MNALRIEAVTVSVNYADFLEATLAENLPQVDHMVVVTSPDDRATQALCQRLSVTCLPTDVLYEHGEKFNKAKAINYGLAHTHPGNWRLHLDADIALPQGFRRMMDHARLDESCIYGCDRLNVVTADAWKALKDKQHNQYGYHYLVAPPSGYALGSRLVHSEFGYCPIGFFQLWHSSKGMRYPIAHGSAEHDDVMFSAQWSHANRRLLSELFVYHLESEKAKMGANWKGRTTAPFGKPVAADAKGKNYC